MVQQPKECPGCDGKGWQLRNDNIKITCPMCGGTGIFAPAGTVIFRVMPQPIINVTCPCPDERVTHKPTPGWEYVPPPTVDPYPWRRDHWVGDDPRDWHGPPKVIC